MKTTAEIANEIETYAKQLLDVVKLLRGETK